MTREQYIPTEVIAALRSPESQINKELLSFLNIGDYAEGVDATDQNGRRIKRGVVTSRNKYTYGVTNPHATDGEYDRDEITNDTARSAEPPSDISRKVKGMQEQLTGIEQPPERPPEKPIVYEY